MYSIHHYSIEIYPETIREYINDLNERINTYNKDSIDYIQAMHLIQLNTVKQYVLPTCTLKNMYNSCFFDACISMLSSIEPVVEHCLTRVNYRNNDLVTKSLMKFIISPCNRLFADSSSVKLVTTIFTVKPGDQESVSVAMTIIAEKLGLNGNDVLVTSMESMMSIYKSLQEYNNPKYLIATHAYYHYVDMYLPNYTVAGIIYHSGSNNPLSLSNKPLNPYGDNILIEANGDGLEIKYKSKYMDQYITMDQYTTADNGKYVYLGAVMNRRDITPKIEMKADIELINGKFYACVDDAYEYVNDSPIWMNDSKIDLDIFNGLYYNYNGKVFLQYQNGTFYILNEKNKISGEYNDSCPIFFKNGVRLSDYIKDNKLYVMAWHTVHAMNNIYYVIKDNKCIQVNLKDCVIISGGRRYSVDGVDNDGYINWENKFTKTVYGGLRKCLYNNSKPTSKYSSYYQEFDYDTYYEMRDEKNLLYRMDSGVNWFKGNGVEQSLDGSYSLIDNNHIYVACNYNTYYKTTTDNFYVIFGDYFINYKQLWECTYNDHKYILTREDKTIEIEESEITYLNSDKSIFVNGGNVYIKSNRHDLWYSTLIKNVKIRYYKKGTTTVIDKCIALGNQNMYFKVNDDEYTNGKKNISIKGYSYDNGYTINDRKYVIVGNMCIDLDACTDCTYNEWKVYRDKYLINDDQLYYNDQYIIKTAYEDGIRLSYIPQKLDFNYMVYYNSNLKYYHNKSFGWIYKNKHNEWQRVPPDSPGHYKCYFPQYNALFDDGYSTVKQHTILTDKCQYTKFNKYDGIRYYIPHVILYVRND